MRCQWRRLLCSNGCRWRQEAVRGQERGGCGVRHWLLRCTVSERCEVYQRRAEHARLGAYPGGAQLGRGQVRLVLRGARCVGSNSRATAYTVHPCSTAQGGQQRCENPRDCGEGAHRYDSLCDKDGCDVQRTASAPRSSTARARPSPSTRRSRSPSSLNSSRRTAPTRHRSSRYATTGRAASRFQRRAPPSALRAISTRSRTRTATRRRRSSAPTRRLPRRAASHDVALQRPRDGPRPLSMGRLPLAYALARLDRPPGSTKPGAARGPCPTDSGDPAKIEPGSKAYALFSNIRFGEIGSTDTVFPPAPPMPPSPPPPPLCAKPYAQCGGKLPSGKPWPGPMCCPLGYHCTGNDYYKGCSPDADQAGDDDERQEAGERVASHREPPRFTTYHSKAYGR